MAIALSSMLAPLLRFGPGGDFVSDVSAASSRPGANHSVEAGEGGVFDPNSEGPGNGAMYGSTGHRQPVDAFLASDGAGEEESIGDDRDALVLSDVARRAGALMVAQRLLTAQAAVGQALSRSASFLNAARAPEPPRVLRHPAETPLIAVPAPKPRPSLTRPSTRPGARGVDGLLW